MTSSPEDTGPAARGDGTVYLIHFDQPFKHARHYTGYTTDLPERLEEHRKGRGARLMEVIKDAGISWHVTRTWPGGRNLERAIKDRHNAPRLCPDCTPQPQPGTGRRAAARSAGRPQAAGPPSQRQITQLCDGWLAEKRAREPEPELEIG